MYPSLWESRVVSDAWRVSHQQQEAVGWFSQQQQRRVVSKRRPICSSRLPTTQTDIGRPRYTTARKIGACLEQTHAMNWSKYCGGKYYCLLKVSTVNVVVKSGMCLYVAGESGQMPRAAWCWFQCTQTSGGVPQCQGSWKDGAWRCT